jgi:hypothetical protein
VLAKVEIVTFVVPTGAVTSTVQTRKPVVCVHSGEPAISATVTVLPPATVTVLPPATVSVAERVAADT